ncbi:hypothetical protein V6N11_075252 [Hibiscus sabdariffa]|uniref:Uncharacterized protein n=1 Tax=Hibiscus sabdariffa TaxID=183260 RepID=A0ABR2R603_9ROSI
MIMNVDVATLDADGGEGQQAAVRISDDVGGWIDKGACNSVTYASVTAKSMLDRSSKKPPVATIDEDIVILEEDVIMNREEKNSIDSVLKVHDQVD